MDSWWFGAPRSARIMALVGVVALLYGTVVHIAQLMITTGDPYPTLPDWLGVYFMSLTVLDPLAAALLSRCRRSGLVLSCAVLLTDAIANGYANYRLDTSTGVTLGRVGHTVITLLATTFTIATVRLWPASRPRERSRRRPSCSDPAHDSLDERRPAGDDADPGHPPAD